MNGDGTAVTPSSRAIAGRPGLLPGSLLLTIPLIVAAIVYYPITHNYFHEDDFLHLYQLANFPRGAFLLYPHAGHLYLARNAVFMLFAQCFGDNPAGYYWAALLTHLANVGLCALVIRRLTGSAVLGCFGAVLWGISPLNEGALGWFSVYGQVLAGAAILLLLYDLAGAAAPGAPSGRRRRGLWYGLALVAATSFGTGLGVALALPLAIAILLPVSTQRGLRRTPLLSLVVVLPVLHVALLWFWTAWTGRRPVAVPVVTGSYLELVWLAVPALLHLLAYGTTNLLLGFFGSAVDYTGALSLGIGLLVAGATIAAAWPTDPGWRRPAAIAVLVLANYGSIALGRSFLYAGLGEQFAATARYHYTGSMLLAILVCTVLSRWEQWISLPPPWKTGLLAAWLAGTGAAYAAHPPVYDHHDDERRQAGKVLTAIRAAIRAAPPGADAYIPNGRFNASWLWRPADFPGWAGLFVVVFPDNVVEGRRVRFVTKNRMLLEASRDGRRSANLFVDRLPPGREPVADDRPAAEAGPP